MGWLEGHSWRSDHGDERSGAQWSRCHGTLVPCSAPGHLSPPAPLLSSYGGEGSRTHSGKWAYRSDYETHIPLIFLLTNIFIKCPLFWNVLYYSMNFREDDVMHIYFPRCSDNSSRHPVGSFYYWDLGWSLLSPQPQTRHVGNVLDNAHRWCLFNAYECFHTLRIYYSYK